MVDETRVPTNAMLSMQFEQLRKDLTANGVNTLRADERLLRMILGQQARIEALEARLAVLEAPPLTETP